MSKLPPGEGQPNPENLPENLARIKEQLLKGYVGGTYEAPVIEDCEVKTVYDTGNQPELGTSRNDDAVLRLTLPDGTVHYAKVNYSFRSQTPNEVTFMGEPEANEFIRTESEYFKQQTKEQK